MKKLHVYTLVFFMILFNHLLAQDIFINEFMSSNQLTLMDSDGDFSDWIEFFNKGNSTINLEESFISDDTLNPAKWKFPAIHIFPGKFLLIFASGKDRYDTTELHTNFKLNAEGEYLILSNPDTVMMDCMTPSEMQTDITYGRFPDGETDPLILISPTPKSANTPGAASLVVSAPAGLYTQPFKVGFSAGSNDDIIYYTLDGSLPDENSMIYSDSIQVGFMDDLPNVISEIPTTPAIMGDHFRKWSPPSGIVPKARVIRAVAIRGGIIRSPVVTNTYFIDTNFNSKYPLH
nr:lamin tail domain-containing protein [Bacteroidota bacterium]